MKPLTIAQKIFREWMIEQPQLPPECWHGLARAVIDAAITSPQSHTPHRQET